MSPQGEPEFDRLKREVEEVKAHQRGLDGTYRTAAGARVGALVLRPALPCLLVPAPPHHLVHS